MPFVSRVCTTVFIALLLPEGSVLADSSTASAGKQVHTAQAAVDAARAQLNQIRIKVKTQLASRPEWSSALSELKSAQIAFTQTKHKALASLAKDPEYQRLVNEREQAKQMLSSAASSDKEDSIIKKAAELVFSDGLEIVHREQQVLEQDQTYQDAKARFDAARSKADDLDSQATQAMQNDPGYPQAQQQLAGAEQQLQSARHQLSQAVQNEEQQRQAKIKAEQQQQNTGY